MKTKTNRSIWKTFLLTDAGSDVNICKSQVSATLSPTNFRNDVNTTGSITGSDVNVVKSQVGTVLPP